jgi:hypothetical protein
MAQGQEQECVWCERAIAIFGIIIAAGLAYMAVDSLLDGRIARGFARSVHLAPVLNLPTTEAEPGA